MCTQGFRRSSLLGVGCAILFVSAGLAQPVFHALGNLGGSSSHGAGVSSIGVALLTAENANFDTLAATSVGAGLTARPTLGGSFGEAGDLSSDGLIAVGGASTSAGREHPVRWLDGGVQDLGTLSGGQTGFATSTGALGAVVSGWGTNASAQTIAFRWSAADGLVSLGTLGGTSSMGLGVSGDGATVVGFARTSAGQTHAFRHTVAGGMVDLGVFAGGSFSQAESASADGSVIVGSATNSSSSSRGFRWTAAGMSDIGTLNGGSGVSALDVSADGQRIVGEAGTDDGSRAFLWTQGLAMQDLNAVFASVIPAGWTLYRAESISPNGRFIVGTGFNPNGGQEAWLLDTGSQCPADFNQSGSLTVQDIFDFLAAWFAGNPGADFNHIGGLSVQDIFDFLGAWFAGC